MTEQEIEQSLIDKLGDLKYTYRPDIRDRAAMEHNFREKFEALNRIHLTDAEFQRLLDEIVTADVFAAARLPRGINSFTRDDTWYFANNNPRHFAFNADERFLPIYQFAVEENTNTAALVRRLLSEDYADKVIDTTIQNRKLARDTSKKRNYHERLTAWTALDRAVGFKMNALPE